MNEKINKAQKHVHRNRAKYAAAATLTACAAVYVTAAKQWNDFLAEENLTDKFYNTKEV